MRCQLRYRRHAKEVVKIALADLQFADLYSFRRRAQTDPGRPGARRTGKRVLEGGGRVPECILNAMHATASVV